MKFRLPISFFAVLAIFSALANSQSQTPAPTKTSTPTPTDTNIQRPPSTPSVAARPIQPFTQADLSVLVGNVQRPNGIVWFNRKLYTACNGDWTLYEIDAITGATQTFIFGVKNAHTLYAEPTDQGFNLWIPDFDSNRLIRLNQSRTAPVEVVRNLPTPWGIAPLNDAFLVSSVRGNELLRITRRGDVESVLKDLRSPAGIVVDEDRVYWANNGSARRAIEWLPIADLGSPDAAPRVLVSGLQNASGLVLAEDGYLYFTYALGTRGVVGRVDPAVCAENACSNDQAEIVVYTELQAPLAGLAISPDMRLYVHTIFRPEIYWVDLYR
ncbi:MAG: hypothetical protein RML73_08710 [Anaerolineae bacterium]|nr:hypothetical protein [Anaerolineae bacterium]